MSKWQVTGATLWCEYVNDWCVVMIRKDWGFDCAYYNKYSEILDDRVKHKKLAGCVKPENCPIIAKYKEKLIQEESLAATT